MTRDLLSVGPAANLDGSRSGAFTLLELLVVIAIIGILMTVALPQLKGFGQSNAMTAATRQLLDDIALARDTAIATRSDVYMVFVPAANQWTYSANGTIVPNNLTSPFYSPVELKLLTNLFSGQYTTYALYATRRVGDQPGVVDPRYLTPWRTLPTGTFIPTAMFNYNPIPLPQYTLSAPYTNGYIPFPTNMAFYFPTATNFNATMNQLWLPYIDFNYTGGLNTNQDVIIPLARGSVFYPRQGNGVIAFPFTPDAEENPLSNSVNQYNDVRIDWLTGRARVERPQLQ